MTISALTPAALEALERDQSFLLALGDAVLDEADPRRILATTLAALGAHLNVSRANYAEADAGGETLHVEQDWTNGVDSVTGASFPLAALGEAVVRDHLSGAPFRTEDIAADPRFDETNSETYRAVGAVAFVSVPLVRAGRLAGVLSVQSVRPRVWTDGEVRLLREVAERNWATLERARSEQRLRESEEQFRTLAENLPSLCFVTDPQGTLLWANKPFRDFHGDHRLMEPGDVAKIADPDEAARTEAIWRSALASGEPVNTRAELFGADGIKRPFLAQTRPVRDDRGRIVRWCGVLTDLSDQVAREERQQFLMDLAERLRAERDGKAILTLTAEMLCQRLDADRVHYAEVHGEAELVIRGSWARPGVEAHMGRHDFRPFGAEALEGHRRGRTMVINDITRAISDPDALATFVRYDIGSGITVPLTAEGRIIAFMSVQQRVARRWTQDEVALTVEVAERGWSALKRAQAEAELEQSRQALAQSEKLNALGSLLAGVSHELNNPLSIIVAQSVMLQRQAAASPYADRADKIRKAADRCARIVQTFLAMARQRPPERKAIELNDLVVAALDLTEYGLRGAGIAIARELTSAPTPVFADADQLHQVLANLIVNAQHALQGVEGERRLAIATRIDTTAGRVVLEIADNGPGVPREIRQRVFEPFFTTRAQDGGTGVGLSFSHGVVEAHGGSLELLDTEVGACFRLSLPYRPAANEGLADKATAAAEPPRRKALIVDDELDIAEALGDLLDLLGFDCDVAPGGRAAKSRLAHRDRAYDLILSDLRMPDVDGPALFDWIAAERPDLVDRVAFATGDTLGAHAGAFLARAGRPYVEKPFTPESLTALIDRLEIA